MRVEPPSLTERRLRAAAVAARANPAARGAGSSVQRQARTSATRVVSFSFFLVSEDILFILFGVPRPARPPRANARPKPRGSTLKRAPHNAAKRVVHVLSKALRRAPVRGKV